MLHCSRPLRYLMRTAYGFELFLSIDLLERSSWTTGYLSSFPATIAGGTKDIQKNILGERVLGLPR